MSNQPVPSRDELETMYTQMVVSRKYEDFMKAAYLEGKMPVFNMTKGPLPGEMHISSGQEPCAVGVCIHLTDKDFVTAPHRPHHIAIAKGVPLDPMTAEIFGKEEGFSRGKGGHMHLFAPEQGFSCTGIVGQGIGVAAGHALAAQLDGSDAVGVAFAGEGAANQGIFHETMNLAALWKLPFILVIEDNDYGVSVSKDRSTAIARNSDRASAYGCAGEFVDNNDVWAVYAAAKRAIDRARAGEGPTIIEIKTYRLEGHFVGDPETYVEQRHIDVRSDPIDVMGARMMAEEGFTQADLDRIHEQAEHAVKQAETVGRDAAYPQGETAFENVFV